MYRTAVINDEISQDYRTACALATKYGLDGMEIRSVNEKNPFDMNRSDWESIKRISDDFGLKIAAVSSPLFKCDLNNEQEIEAHYEGLKRCAEAAHLWGTNLIRGFTFWRTPNPEQDFARIAERYEKAIQIAEQEDIEIVIESEPSVCTVNMQMLYDFLQLVPSKRIGALYDAGNEATDPSWPAPYPYGYELLKPYIRHVHLKDTKATYDGAFYEPALIGEGDVDYEGLIRRLKADRYDGWVSVETHYRIRRKAFSEAELARPQGTAFSEGGYEATEAYFQILRDRFDWQGEKK